MIPKQNYYDQSIFDSEIERVFNHSWLFAGMVDDVANPNDFVTFEIGRRPIVIQNFNGEIAAFDNICSHRFSKIQIQDKGNRPFFCQYHGWTYNKNGNLVGIPKKNSFDFPNDMSCFNLVKHRVEICGKFIFVNFNSESENLESYLGVFFETLQEISIHLGEKILNKDIIHESNWKFLVENVLEGYHCAIVHPETLYKSGFCNVFAEDLVFDKGHSKWRSPKVDTDFSAKRSKMLSFLDNRTFKHPSFYHVYIYPNLFFSSTEGQLFYIGQNIPINSELTNLKTSFYGPKIPNLEENKTSIFNAFLNSAVESGLTVLNEDKKIIENIQKVLPFSKSNGILSKEEIRLTDFFKRYAND